jgi:SsrA-binding protein
VSARNKKPTPGERRIVVNRKARFEYEVIEQLEAGIVLTGTEVKSLRDGKIQLADAYGRIEGGEAFLMHANIATYENGTIFNHDPIRPRKLLLHRREIDRLYAQIREKGLTLIPLELYFKEGRVKVALGLCRGKARYDKRASIRARDERRAAEREG